MKPPKEEEPRLVVVCGLELGPAAAEESPPRLLIEPEPSELDNGGRLD
jgi:hypothetical protein